MYITIIINKQKIWARSKMFCERIVLLFSFTFSRLTKQIKSSCADVSLNNNFLKLFCFVSAVQFS